MSQGREGSQYNVIGILLNLLDVSTAKRLSAWITRTLSSCTALSILCSTTWRSTCSHLVTWSPNSWPQPSDPSFPASLHTHTHTHIRNDGSLLVIGKSDHVCRVQFWSCRSGSSCPAARPGTRVVEWLCDELPHCSSMLDSWETRVLKLSSCFVTVADYPLGRIGSCLRPGMVRGPARSLWIFLYLINVHVFVKQHKLVDLV